MLCRNKNYQNEIGVKMATFAAMLERRGDYGSAWKLWLDSLDYPCNKKNLTWRQNRASYCEYRAFKTVSGSFLPLKQNHLSEQ